MPAVSIIIPCYNCAATIARSIDSVLAQSFGDFECILVDDCSTDDSLSVIKGFDDPRFHVIEHAQNRGAAAARNTAINHAKGEFIAFLDADDRWSEGKLRQQVAYMQENPQINASCTSFYMYRDVNTKILRELNPHKRTLKEMLTVCNVAPGSTLMARRRIFADDQIGLLPEALTRFEDWDWLIEYSYDHHLGIIEAALSDVFVTGFARYDNIVIASEILFARQKDRIRDTLGRAYVGYFKATLEQECASAAFRNKRYLRAIWHLGRSCVLSPKRVYKFARRIVKKLATRDYSRSEVQAFK